MEIRLAATRYIWSAFALIMVALMSTSIFGNSDLGVGHVIIAVVLSIAAFLCTGTVWNWGDSSNGAGSIDAVALSSKQKRSSVDRLAGELDSMSDEDLERLRTRLSSDVRDVLTTSGYGVADDGELMRR